jgi:hypothetical protein
MGKFDLNDNLFDYRFNLSVELNKFLFDDGIKLLDLIILQFFQTLINYYYFRYYYY